MPGDGAAPGKLPDAPSEADIRELYTALELDAQGEPPPEDQAAATKAGYMVYQLQVCAFNRAQECKGSGLKREL